MAKEAIREIKADQVGTEAIGNVTYWRVTAGSSTGDLLLTITGLNLATPSPWTTVFQSRQTDNVDHGWPDQFAIQVIRTSQTFILVRIRSLDIPGSGLGQQLGLNFIVRE